MRRTAVRSALIATFLASLILFAFMANVKAYSYNLVDGNVDTSNMGSNSQRNEHPSGTTIDSAFGFAFTANASYTLGYVQFYMDKVGSPTSDLVSAVYNTTGTVGAFARPDGNPALAYSSLVDSATLNSGGASSWITFNFTNSLLSIVNQSDYAISVEVNSTNVDTNHYVRTRVDGNAGHAGNRFKYDSNAWAGLPAAYDAIFRVYELLSPPDVTDPSIDYLGFNSTLNGTNSEFTFNFSDNVGLSHFVYGWNNSGSWVNSTYVLSGTQNQTLITFTLNATSGVKVEWRLWVNDTVNNWADIPLSFFITNTEPIIITITSAQLFIGLMLLVCVVGGVVYFGLRND